MSELKKEKLLEQLDYWKLECQTCAQHHNYDCDDGCIVQNECEQARQQIKEMIRNHISKEELFEIKAQEYERGLSDAHKKKPEELKDLIRICNAAMGFAEERGLGDLEDKAEVWERNFNTILNTHKKKKEAK